MSLVHGNFARSCGKHACMLHFADCVGPFVQWQFFSTNTPRHRSSALQPRRNQTGCLWYLHPIKKYCTMHVHVGTHVGGAKVELVEVEDDRGEVVQVTLVPRGGLHPAPPYRFYYPDTQACRPCIIPRNDWLAVPRPFGRHSQKDAIENICVQILWCSISADSALRLWSTFGVSG